VSNKPCILCGVIEHPEPGRELISGYPASSLFIGTWDINPATPGHVLLLPRRHVQYMHELTTGEQQALIAAVIHTKDLISHLDLRAVYRRLASTFAGQTSETYLRQALESVEALDGRPPDSFNDGLNDGPAAGQTIPHLHWHIMPRWRGDTPDPRGGIRHMFDGMGNYEAGLRP
jgi:ATP adenylyltransferase